MQETGASQTKTIGETKIINCFPGTESLANTRNTLLLFSLKPFISFWRDSRSQPHSQGLGLSQQTPRACAPRYRQDQMWHVARSSQVGTHPILHHSCSNVPKGPGTSQSRTSTLDLMNSFVTFWSSKKASVPRCATNRAQVRHLNKHLLLCSTKASKKTLSPEKETCPFPVSGIKH